MRKATAFIAVMAWAVLAGAVIPLFIAQGDSEVLMANSKYRNIEISSFLGGAAVSAEANKAVVNAAPVQETMKSKDSVIVIDNGAPIKDGVTVPMVSYGQNTKVVLGRGQTLSYIAWKYTGDVDNWKHIAQASGIKLDIKSQKRVFVGTILTIPQELLKQELRPSPPAVVVEVLQSAVEIAEKDLAKLQKELNDADWWMWYWAIVSGVLGLSFLAALFSYFRERRDHDLWYGQMEHFREQAAILPGNLMDFKTREGRVLHAMITKVELIEEHGCIVKPVITEVDCTKCHIRVNPKNFLSHYFKQHAAPLVITTECLVTEVPPKKEGC